MIVFSTHFVIPAEAGAGLNPPLLQTTPRRHSERSEESLTKNKGIAG